MASSFGDFGVEIAELEFMELGDDCSLLQSMLEPFDESLETIPTKFTVTVDEPSPLPQTADDPPAECQRFPQLNEDDLNSLLAESTSKATEKMTKWGVSILKKWLIQRGKSSDFEELSCGQMDDVLRKLYAEIRNADGKPYGKSTFVGIRAAISRHLKNPPHNKSYALMGNVDFHKSNQMFSAMLKLMKKEGLDTTTHYKPISELDLAKLKQSDVLSSKTPKALQRKVWFDLTLNFARRGRENLRSIKQDCFNFHSDEAGVEFCEMAYNESTKNHKGDNVKDIDSTIRPRMYANQEDSCPLKSLKTYLSKLNQESDHLFQQPKRVVSESDSTWYTSRPVGERSINDMMKGISAEAGLSKMYTNHCVRATAITLLAHAGVETREIMKISGHRNESSVRSYNADSSASQKRHYSSILQGHLPHPLLEQNHAMVQCPQSSSATDVVQVRSHYSTNINQRIMQTPPVTVNRQKQFEINHSVVHIHNHYGHQF